MHISTENRIVILGNSGSGKSYLSGVLSSALELTRISLDDICWEPGGYFKRRSDELVETELLDFSKKKNWIVEGVYGNFAEVLLSRSNLLVWLDIDPDFCAESVSKRGFDNIPWMDTDVKIRGYLNHIRSYKKNSGPMSHSYHSDVFKKFDGLKKAFVSRDEVNAFIDQLEK